MRKSRDKGRSRSAVERCRRLVTPLRRSRIAVSNWPRPIELLPLDEGEPGLSEACDDERGSAAWSTAQQRSKSERETYKVGPARGGRRRRRRWCGRGLSGLERRRLLLPLDFGLGVGSLHLGVGAL